MQRTKCNVKIFSDPMPGSNERSVQLVGSNEQIKECVEHFLEDIGKVRVVTWKQQVDSCVGEGQGEICLGGKGWVKRSQVTRYYHLPKLCLELCSAGIFFFLAHFF